MSTVPEGRFQAPGHDPRRPSISNLESAVVASGIGHEYRARSGRVSALERVDLRVSAGELVAILGPSGCGKTTLLRILAGLLAPTRGAVTLAGETPSRQHRERALGWLAQDDGLLPWRTVEDNVSLPLRVGRRRPDFDRVYDMLERVGLTDGARRYPHELSGGMRQRAALARALVAHPPFLFLDEPFAHLDELTRERLGGLLLELRATSKPTTVLVTHSVTEAVRLADRAIVFSSRPGRLLADYDIPLRRPRRDDHVGFGAWVHRLKLVLVEGADLTLEGF